MSDDRRRTQPRGIPLRRLNTETPRPRRPSEEHGWDRFQQTVLQALEGLSDAVTQLADDARAFGDRVVTLEKAREREDGAKAVTGKVWNWVLGIIAVLLAALLLSTLKLK